MDSKKFHNSKFKDSDDLKEIVKPISEKCIRIDVSNIIKQRENCISNFFVNPQDLPVHWLSLPTFYTETPIKPILYEKFPTNKQILAHAKWFRMFSIWFDDKYILQQKYVRLDRLNLNVDIISLHCPVCKIPYQCISLHCAATKPSSENDANEEVNDVEADDEKDEDEEDDVEFVEDDEDDEADQGHECDECDEDDECFDKKDDFFHTIAFICFNYPNCKYPLHCMEYPQKYIWSNVKHKMKFGKEQKRLLKFRMAWKKKQYI